MGDDLIARTTISFGRPLKSGDVEDLFKFLAKTTRCEVRYTETQQVIVGFPYAENPNKSERYSQGIEGSFNSTEDSSLSLNFKLFRDLKKGWVPEFGGLKFSTPPGYEIDDRKIRFMNEVGEQTRVHLNPLTEDG